MTEEKDINGNLVYYKNEKTTVHIVLKNRRFYNGIITEIRDNEGIMLLEDKKIGTIPISLSDIFLIETFHEPGE